MGYFERRWRVSFHLHRPTDWLRYKGHPHGINPAVGQPKQPVRKAKWAVPLFSDTKRLICMSATLTGQSGPIALEC
jgi:hypothetical protein